MDSIILVHYIKFERTKTADEVRRIQQSMTVFKERVVKGLEEKGIINLIVPVFEGSSRVECVNPKLVTEAEYKSALDVVNEANKKLEEWISQQQPKD